MLRNAKITNTFLGFEKEVFTFMLQFEGDMWGQAGGGISLVTTTDVWPEGLKLLSEIVEVIGCKSWERLQGQPCRVKQGEDRSIVGMGHFVKDKWVDFK